MIKRFLCILLCALFVFCPLVCATESNEIKNPVFETKPGKDYTAYYIIAAAVGVVVILVLLIIFKKRKSTK